MKRLTLLALVIAPIIITSCSGSKGSGSSSQVPGDSSSSSSITSSDSSPKERPAMVEKEVEIMMGCHFGNTTYQDTLQYSDYWFVQDSYTLNDQLGLASAMTAAASYPEGADTNGQKISNFLKEVGYTNIMKNYYYANDEKLTDSIGCLIASKKIIDNNDKVYTLLAIFPRNAGYEEEWMGNFNIGTSGLHTGFELARDEILRFTKKYIDSNQISGDIKIWSPGYSRGAAAVNLVGGYLADNSSYLGNDIKLSSHDIFVYTIASPNVLPTGLKRNEVLNVSGPRENGYHDTNVVAYTYNGEDAVVVPSADQYKGIHNYVAYGDYVTKVPPASYSFTRYGQVEMITYGDEAFVNELNKVSPETASKFKDGKNYVTPLPTKTFDFNTFKIVETSNKISADAFINSIFTSIVNKAPTREGLVNLGFSDILGAFITIFGVDWDGFYNGVMSNTGDLIKAGAFAYLASSAESLNMGDSEAVAEILMQVLELLGKDVGDHDQYTDQMFLKDLLDILVNDYQKDSAAQLRSVVLSNLIPAPYGGLYLGVIEYAKNNNIQVANMDQFLLLLAKYVNRNKENADVIDLMGKVAGLIPSQYLMYIPMIVTGNDHADITDPDEKARAIVFDLFDAMENGVKEVDEESGETKTKVTASQTRYLILGFMIPMALSDCENLCHTLMNGASSNEGEITEYDPVPLNVIVTDILKLVLPKDEEGKVLSLKESAKVALIKVLDNGRTEENGPYVDILKGKAEELINLVSIMLFPSLGKYNLNNDISRIFTLIEVVSFVYPAHFHELYIAYLQSRVSVNQ